MGLKSLVASIIFATYSFLAYAQGDETQLGIVDHTQASGVNLGTSKKDIKNSKNKENFKRKRKRTRRESRGKKPPANSIGHNPNSSAAQGLGSSIGLPLGNSGGDIGSYMGEGTSGGASASYGGGVNLGPGKASYDPNTPCGNVTVNCATHKITFSGVALAPADQVINCGKPPATKNGIGRVGGLHHGRIVRDGVDIQMPGMGQDGGGKVFHQPLSGARPNGSNVSRGCIHVNAAVLAKLKTCQGSPLRIMHASGGGSSPPSFQHQTPSSETAQ